MIWQLYKQELKSYFRGEKVFSLLFMLTGILFIEITLSNVKYGIHSIMMGSGLMMYVFFGQIFSTFHARQAGQPDMMEYYLAKPISRIELFWAKLLSVSTICLLLISTVISTNLFNNDTQSMKFSIWGYDNAERISKIESFNAVYDNDSDKKFSEYRHTEIRTLREQGDYQQARKKGQSYSKDFIDDNGLFYVLFLKCFLLVWSAIAAILYINCGDAKSAGEMKMKLLKTPLTYLKSSGLLFLFSLLLTPLIIGERSLNISATYLTFYLVNFKVIVACSLLLLAGLVLTLRKNYLNISI